MTRAAIKGTSQVGGDLAEASKGAVLGVLRGTKEVSGEALNAVSTSAAPAVKGAGDISETAVKEVRDTLTGVIGGVKVVLTEPFESDTKDDSKKA